MQELKQTSQVPDVSGTLLAYAATRILDTPFWGLFNMLPFILYKDFHASPLILVILVTLKPLVPILAPYWSAFVVGRSDRLRGNIIWARCLSLIPFFFFPCIESTYFYVAAYGLYLLFATGSVPAWMELLRRDIPKKKRERLFSYCQAFGYLGGGLFPFMIGGILDDNPQAWRWLFAAVAALGLSAILLQFWIPHTENTSTNSKTLNLGYHLLRPWKAALDLLTTRPDFAGFQSGFMLLGSGLMLLQPTLLVFFADELQLTYTEYAIAITLCKGIGFALGSPLWSRWIHQTTFFLFCSYICGLAALFPLSLLLAQMQGGWLYASYLLYGFMQSGNELVWNLSGPIFADKSDSAPFSSVNLIAGGLRGCIIPSLGGLFLGYFHSPAVMVMASLLCLMAMVRMAAYAIPSGGVIAPPQN